MRTKIIQMAPFLVISMFSQGTRGTKVTANALPEDAELVGVFIHPWNGNVCFVFEHDSWENVQDFEKSPELRPEFQTLLGL
jgi:hypothetical protein